MRYEDGYCIKKPYWAGGEGTWDEEYGASLCKDCGAVILDQTAHDKFHKSFSQAYKNADQASAWISPLK